MPDMEEIGADEEIGRRKRRRKRRHAGRRRKYVRFPMPVPADSREMEQDAAPESEAPAETDYLPAESGAPGTAEGEMAAEGERVEGSITFTYPEGFGVTVGIESVAGPRDWLRRARRAIVKAIRSPAIKAMARTAVKAFSGAGVSMPAARAGLSLIHRARKRDPEALEQIRSLESRAGQGDATATRALATLEKVARVRNEIAVSVPQGRVILIRPYYDRGFTALARR